MNFIKQTISKPFMRPKLMRTILITLCLAGIAYSEESLDPQRAANTVLLDETGVKNLRIETTEVEETEFEETALSLGRIEAIPASRSGVSSRVAGRIVELKASVGDEVTAGQEVARLEARVAGNPPPIITLTASANGLVTKGNVALGDPLEPEASLMEITDLREVHAIARVPEHIAGKMAPGTMARIKVPAISNENFEGELLRFGTESDRASATIDAVFKLPNPNLTLRPGMRAEFSIVLKKRENVMSVPRSALQGEPSNRFLFVKDFDLKNAFVKTSVEVGQMNDQSAEILSGLLPGDEVVTQGAYSLAFAGGGNVSLIEALDAAHGHKHNPDGSEIKEGEGGGHAEGDGHDHDGGEKTGGGIFWKIVSGVLALVVVGQIFAKRGGSAEETAPAVEPIQ